MEAEIIIIAHRCHELFPFMNGVSIKEKAIGIVVGNNNIKVSIHKDNAGALGALVLAETLPTQFISQSKHYHLKTTWFQRRL